MFHWVELRAFCHATEEEGRVLAALQTVLPEGEVHREAIEGHFGNPLVSFAVRAEKAADIREFWRRLVAAFGRDGVVRDLEARVDEDGVYHLRLDKQRAFGGAIERAASPDVIDARVKIASYPKKRETAVAVAREFLEAL